MSENTEKKENKDNLQRINNKKTIKDELFNNEEALKKSGEVYSTKLGNYLSQSTVKNKKSLLKEVIYVKREGTIFEIPLKEVLIFNIPLFRCKRCGNIWGTQNKNTPSKFPLRCSKCNVKYWFVTKEEMKKLGLLKKNVVYSLDKSKLKVIDLEPKRKYKVKKEDNEEW